MARSLTADLKPHERIILPWDQGNFNEHGKETLNRLLPHIGMVKLGYQAIYSRALFSTVAFDVIQHVTGPAGRGYFLDGKLKDIENTVVEAIKVMSKWPVPPRIITIHATMRYKTIVAALNAVRGSTILVAGVSLLTDHDDTDADEIYNVDAIDVVLDCADRLAMASEETGVPAALVCAPPDLEVLARNSDYDNLIRITPGIRETDAPPDDQARTMTARDAIIAGADYLVIGRPVMKAPDPVAAAAGFAKQIEDALMAAQATA